MDHVVSSNHDGFDDLSNLQALCIADAHSDALLPVPGILAAVQGDHEDFSALLAEIDGIGKSTQHKPADPAVNQGKRLGTAAPGLARWALQRRSSSTQR